VGTLRTLVVGALASTLLISSTALAQPEGEEIELEEQPAEDKPPEPPPPPKKDVKAAKKAFAAAQQQVVKGDGLAKRGKAEDARVAYEAALALFVTATDLGEDINYYYYLAQVEDKLGKYVEAVKHYRMVMRAQSGVNPAIAKVITTKLDEEMAKIGTVQLTVTPDGAAVMLGGEQVGTTPLPEPLVLLPGTYTFSFNAPGYQPKEAELKVEAGSESERKIELESVAIIIDKPRKVDPDEVEDKPQPKKPSMIPVFVGGGVALVALGTAIVTGMAASSQHDIFLDPNSTPTQRRDAKEVGTDYAHLTDAMLGVSIVAAGFTAYWYIFQVRPGMAKYDAETAGSTRTSKVDIVPWVQRDASGFTVLGRF